MAMSSKVHNLFDWVRLFPGTIGGIAHRNGRRGIPHADAWREIQTYTPDAAQAGQVATGVLLKQFASPGDGHGASVFHAPWAVTGKGHAGGQPVPRDEADAGPTASSNAATPGGVLVSDEAPPPNLVTGPATGDGPRRPRLSYFEHVLIDLTNIKITHVAEEWEKARHGLKARLKLIRHRMQALLEEYRAAEARHRTKDLRIPSRIPWWVYLLLLFMAVAETAFNAGAFLVFRLPIEEQYMIAASASVAILVTAKHLGIWARQLSGAGRGSWRAHRGFLGLAGVVLVAQLAVAVMREQYIAWAQKIEMDPTRVLLLFIFGLLIPLGSAMAVFQCADPDPELGNIVKQKARCRQCLERSWADWNRLDPHDETLRALTRLRVARLQDKARAEIDEYRHFNTSARAENEKIPPYFQEAISDVLFRPVDFGPELDLTPPPLDELLESCQASSEEEPRHDS